MERIEMNTFRYVNGVARRKAKKVRSFGSRLGKMLVSVSPARINMVMDTTSSCQQRR
jgi:hypothetical protein